MFFNSFILKWDVVSQASHKLHIEFSRMINIKRDGSGRINV